VAGAFPASVLLSLDADLVVAACVRRIEQDGTIILDIRQPLALAFGRVVAISSADDAGWATTRVRVERPYFRPHIDAGLLRLTPIVSPDTATMPTPEPAVIDAGDDATAPREASVGDRRPLGNLRPWRGSHPTGAVGIRLKSGRVWTVNVARIDEDGLLVTALPRPSVLAEDDTLDIAWSEQRGWLTATTIVAPTRTGQHPEAGLLRLELQSGPTKQRERRSSRRVGVRLAVRGVVERGARPIRGERIETVTIDVATGGVAIATDLDLTTGDRLRIRLIGPDGQLPGGEIAVDVRRVEPLSEATRRRVVLAWRDPPPELTRALRRLVELAS
jgi:hypothetical protein